MMKGDFDKEKIKKVLNKTLKDIQKFEKFSQEDKKKIKDLQSEKKQAAAYSHIVFRKKTKPLKNSFRCLRKT